MSLLRTSGALVLLLVLAGCGRAGAYGITVVADGTHRLDGDRPGAVLVAGGDATVPAEARVGGSVWVLAGSLTLGGTVEGDLSVLGGRARLERGAAVNGDVNLGGGDVSGLAEARVGGAVTERAGIDVPLSPAWESEQPVAVRVALRAAAALLAGLLAAAFALVAPRPLEQVGDAATTQPLVTLALGLLGVIVALPLLVFMAFTGVLIPIAALGLLLLALALVLGWTATGAALLVRLRPRAARLPLPASAAGGAAALTLAVGVVEPIPLVGFVAVAGLSSVSFGAVLLTRLGTRAAARSPAEVPRSSAETPA